MSGYELYCTRTFDAAHQLFWHPGQCRLLHGHTWKVEVWLKTDRLDDNGLVCDFHAIKEVIDRYDHIYLNDYFENPTAETLARVLHVRISNLLEDGGKVDCTVRVWESPDASITYSGPICG